MHNLPKSFIAIVLITLIVFALAGCMTTQRVSPISPVPVMEVVQAKAPIPVIEPTPTPTPVPVPVPAP